MTNNVSIVPYDESCRDEARLARSQGTAPIKDTADKDRAVCGSPSQNPPTQH